MLVRADLLSQQEQQITFKIVKPRELKPHESFGHMIYGTSAKLERKENFKTKIPFRV